MNLLDAAQITGFAQLHRYQRCGSTASVEFRAKSEITIVNEGN